MSRVITFSRTFPSYHPRKGESTLFVEKVWGSLLFDCGYNFDLDFIDLESDIKSYYDKHSIEYKHHTIRAGNRWKVGDWFSPRVWSGKPYNSKQIAIAPDVQIKKIWGFTIEDSVIRIHGSSQSACRLYDVPANEVPFIANNDGLSFLDFMHWFQYPKDFEGQIICWNEKIDY